MYYVYLLKLANNKLYVGSTNNLKRRILEHRKGNTRSTKSQRPVQLIYYEAYADREDSIARERYFKTGDGRHSIKKQLKNTLAARLADTLASSSNG